MMFLIYLGNRFVYRMFDFFKHWYFDGTKNYAHYIISELEKMDQTIAFRITLKYIFEPLYQDRSLIGYILGFIFRSIRLLIGAVLYGIIILIAIFLYLIWVMIPIYIIYKILSPLSRSFLG